LIFVGEPGALGRIRATSYFPALAKTYSPALTRSSHRSFSSRAAAAAACVGRPRSGRGTWRANAARRERARAFATMNPIRQTNPKARRSERDRRCRRNDVTIDSDFAEMTPMNSEEREAALATVALAFAEALVRGDWSAAHTMLAPALRDDWQASDLRREFDEMTSYWDKPANSVKLGLADGERAYVSISSVSDQYGTVHEAVDVRVIQDGDHWLIDDIVWGRP
jgi:hypothetical protein